MWFVVSLVLAVQSSRFTIQCAVEALVLSGWMMSGVEEESPRYLTVAIAVGESTTAAIGRMQESFVKSCNAIVTSSLEQTDCETL